MKLRLPSEIRKGFGPLSLTLGNLASLPPHVPHDFRTPPPHGPAPAPATRPARHRAPRPTPRPATHLSRPSARHPQSVAPPPPSRAPPPSGPPPLHPQSAPITPSPEEPPLSRDPLTGEPLTGAPTASAPTAAIPGQTRAAARPADPLARFNTAPEAAAEAVLLACCGSRRWARRVAAHRPYPTVEALLAAADEAAYDMSGADLDEALGDETPPGLPPGTPWSAHTALRHAHEAYLARFGHAFVVCLDTDRPEEHLDRVLGGIRSRLDNEPEEERVASAEELRRVTRARLIHLVTEKGGLTGYSRPSVAV
ncbi:2-oxo-4-hydroxy-4-carboxy-5-ureidoimidazoline decarboxylase [Streptomyces fradiae]|uniref:2-oxo-4-hydroxy-4-carboxy-5-ureidoimidazoline decarboxylase n=1 Tax=Streptomyces fradiae TaxID=1906 RepID=UPI003F4CF544